jgi:hypothetical protein
VVRCDLADRDAVMALTEGVDAVLHFGGVSVEDKFENIMNANILGLHHLYEAVHKRGIRRVIYASSSHVVGYYPTTQVVDASVPLRPDGIYGVSKCFGEALSRYYYDRFGIETVCLRIGSSFDAPRNARMMTTFLAYDDLVELVRCALFTPRVGHTITYGVSDNSVKWWDNREAAHLGFVPQKSSWSWCDALFMGPPTWTRLYAATGDKRYLEHAVSAVVAHLGLPVRQGRAPLLPRQQCLHQREANGAKVFWARGNGWVMAGLARTLQYLPANHPSRARFEQQFKEMAAKVVTLQQKDGLWRASLLDPASYPMQETSGTGLFAYALAWGVNQGLLDVRGAYEPAVLLAGSEVYRMARAGDEQAADGAA